MLVLQLLQCILQLMHSALRRLDLNLLLVFDALYRQRSVVAAAQELALSASALSHALARLRAALNDELFLRVGGAMHPTPKAAELSVGIAQALQLLSDQIGDASSFDPASSDQTFLFAATDFTSFAILPTLIARIEKAAPRIRVQVISSDSRHAADDLRAGAHFVLGFSDEFAESPPELERIEAATDDYVVVARRAHPRVGKTLSLKRYLAERHVVVRPWRQERGVIDSTLAQKGMSRSVAVEIPSVMAAPFIVARSDLLITLPRKAAQVLAQSAQVTLYATPFQTPRYTPTVYYQRHHLHAAWHRWMRGEIGQCMEELPLG